jgi:catechol 2,3-dioxygenase-like lactoylglutathione lyase family enzyme
MKCSLSFVELYVRDWPASVAWYRDVLGLELILRADADQFALFAAGMARLALKAGDPGSSETLLVFEVDVLEEWVLRLAQCSVPLDGPVKDSSEGYRRIRLRDPDGHALCLFAWLQQDRGLLA